MAIYKILMIWHFAFSTLLLRDGTKIKVLELGDSTEDVMSVAFDVFEGVPVQGEAPQMLKFT